ncbi:MAG TPA: hypothetical protein VFT34_08595 [Verrucomicrobiae bacterium]|nr:hypothetical protein [Verrucomicrobiae bacterium]
MKIKYNLPWIIIFLFLFSTFVRAGEADNYAEKIAPLADPENHSEALTVRLPKIIYWLAVAKQNNVDVTNVLNIALGRVMTNKWAGEPEIIRLRGGKVYTNDAPIRNFTTSSLLGNLYLAEQHGCVDEEALEQLRRGQAPTIKKTRYAGDRLSADYVIPITVLPELENLFMNIQLAPSRTKPIDRRMRQSAYAIRFNELGLLPDASYRKFLQWIQPAKPHG